MGNCRSVITKHLFPTDTPLAPPPDLTIPYKTTSDDRYMLKRTIHFVRVGKAYVLRIIVDCRAEQYVQWFFRDASTLSGLITDVIRGNYGVIDLEIEYAEIEVKITDAYRGDAFCATPTDMLKELFPKLKLIRLWLTSPTATWSCNSYSHKDVAIEFSAEASKFRECVMEDFKANQINGIANRLDRSNELTAEVLKQLKTLTASIDHVAGKTVIVDGDGVEEEKINLDGID